MKDAEQQVKRQLGKERREAGFSKPIPGEIWLTRGVKQAMQSTVDYIESLGKVNFEEDYQFLEKINKLNNSVNAEYERRALNISIRRETIPRSRNARSLLRLPEKPTQITQGTALEWQCGLAAGEYMAREMERDDKVYVFRQQFSEGKLLTMQQAWDMLTNPLFHILSLSDFECLDLLAADCTGRVFRMPQDSMETPMPIRKWEAKLLATSRVVPYDKELQWLTVEIETVASNPIRRHVLQGDKTPLEGYFPLVTRAEFFGESGPMVHPALEAYENAWGLAGQEYVEAWWEAAAGSVVMSASDVAYELVNCDWPISHPDALRFVLTGLPPRIAPIEINYVSRSPLVWEYKYWEKKDGEEPEDNQEEYDIVELDQSFSSAALIVQPWVQPEAVANFWRQTRSGANRTLPLTDNLSLFQFVIKQTPPGQPFQWQALADQWNQEHGQNLSRSVIKTIYSRTLAALLPTKRQEGGTGSN